MQIEQIKVTDLTAYARNSRTHSAEQINFTGLQATLENDGRTFAEIKASRCS